MCRNCRGGGSATTSPEAQDGSQNINCIRAYQAPYTAPLSGRLLVEAGFGAVNPSYGNPRDGFDRSMRVVDQAATSRTWRLRFRTSRIDRCSGTRCTRSRRGTARRSPT